jgi:hypothetical protein
MEHSFITHSLSILIPVSSDTQRVGPPNFTPFTYPRSIRHPSLQLIDQPLQYIAALIPFEDIFRHDVG